MGMEYYKYDVLWGQVGGGGGPASNAKMDPTGYEVL